MVDRLKCRGIQFDGPMVMTCLAWAMVAAPLEPVAAQVGDQPDGGRSPYVHVIPLYPEDKDGDQGLRVTPGQRNPLPFSMRWTCNNCHEYSVVAKGFHFSSMDPNAAAGRIGQPWIYADPLLAVQIPLSYRPWPGVYRPDQFGISPFEFARRFGRQMPGGGPGEAYAADPSNARQARASGRLEVNCLACHNAHPGQDQGGAFGYADQVREGNYRWAAAASCEFANVRGSVRNAPAGYDPFATGAGPVDANAPLPVAWYAASAFDDHNDVLMDLTRRIPAERCYQCHSNVIVGPEAVQRVLADQDVHMAAGMLCVDCHRNGVDHQISRGYPGQFTDPNRASMDLLTCEGCHLGTATSNSPSAGRMGAPVPGHRGLPLVHFEKLACTSCHSGPWPQAQAGWVKTSRAHGLGTTYAEKADGALPHIVLPVFARLASGKIAPHKAVWPAFWAKVENPGPSTQDSGEGISPIPLQVVEPIAKRVIRNSEIPKTHDWVRLSDEQVAQVLTSLSKQIKGQAVYISGGRMHSLDANARLVSRSHPAAAPVLWPAAHDVRPAGQSLGVRRCRDCHDRGSAFFTAEVPVDTAMVSGQGQHRSMSEFEAVDATKADLFGWSFVFRPWMQAAGLCSGAILILLVLAFGARALVRIAKVFSGREGD